MVVFKGQKLWKPAERYSERMADPYCWRAERGRADRARAVREGGQAVLSGWLRSGTQNCRERFARILRSWKSYEGATVLESTVRDGAKAAVPSVGESLCTILKLKTQTTRGCNRHGGYITWKTAW